VLVNEDHQSGATRRSSPVDIRGCILFFIFFHFLIFFAWLTPKTHHNPSLGYAVFHLH
jgi:hypothetical protein